MMIKSLLEKIHAVIAAAKNRHMLGAYLTNAVRGLSNSQLWAAETYFNVYKNYLEAYAWADVASCNNPQRTYDAEILKKQAFEKLEPEQVKEAWDMAKEYKKRFLPKF